MAHYLTDRDTSELMAVLSSNYVLDACGGTVTVMTMPLPGKAVCAIQEVDQVIYIVVDVEKPLAYRHARQMIREWRASQSGSVMVGDEPIDLVPVTDEPHGPCAVRLVS